MLCPVLWDDSASAARLDQITHCVPSNLTHLVILWLEIIFNPKQYNVSTRLNINFKNKNAETQKQYLADQNVL